MDKSKNLVWIDLEMTGLDPAQDEIIEIATIITDQNLEILSQGPELAITQKPERFQKMDKWNQEHHTKSGLWQKCLESDISIAQAEELTLQFIKEYCDEKTSPLCGNSIWQDRRFLSKYMKNLENWLHYRILDVSSIKLVNNCWYNKKYEFQDKSGSHRALDDIIESISELKFYREKLFIKD